MGPVAFLGVNFPLAALRTILFPRRQSPAAQSVINEQRCGAVPGLAQCPCENVNRDVATLPGVMGRTSSR